MTKHLRLNKNIRLAILSLCLLASPVTAEYVDITSGPLGDLGDGRGVVWSDFDGDGDPDLYLAITSGANRMLRNDGGDTFEDVTTGPLGDPGWSEAVGVADFDNDGDPDLYVANRYGANRLLRNDGDMTFADVTGGAPLGDEEDSRSLDWGDFDNDGDLDLYVGNYGSHAINRLLRNDGAGVFVDASAAPIWNSGDTMFTSWTDYDGDLDADLYLSNWFLQNNWLFRNDGGGEFVNVTSPPLNCAEMSAGFAWGDHDGDGDPDLYIGNEGGANRLVRNDGAGGFVDVTVPPLDDDGPARGVHWIDEDNDGDLDLYVVQLGGSPNLLFRNEGGFVETAAGTPLGDTSSGWMAAWADHDADGDLDVYLSNQLGSSNRLLRNDAGQGHHWLQLRLAGTVSNADGIGARVRVVAGGRSQVREIGADWSWTPVAFGLGEATIVDEVEVRWPSGVVHTLGPLVADQFMQLSEQPTAVRGMTLPAPGRASRLQQNVPNPFYPATRIRFDLARPEVVRVRIFDAGGRTVRVLRDAASLGGGSHVMRWDGRDDRGRSVGSGIYFCRIEAGAWTSTRSMTLVR